MVIRLKHGWLTGATGVASRAKYGNKKTTVEGIVFDSKREAKRYLELKTLERDGAISNVDLQVPYHLVVNGLKVATYYADFVYREGDAVVVEDVKGVKTGVYRLKKKLMKAIYHIDIKEV